MDESEIQKAGKNTASENTSQTEKQTETDSSSVTGVEWLCYFIP